MRRCSVLVLPALNPAASAGPTPVGTRQWASQGMAPSFPGAESRDGAGSAGKGQGRARALTQGLILGREMVYELTAVPGRGGFCHLPSQRISALVCCLGPAGFRSPRAEAQTRLLPHAHCLDRLELPRYRSVCRSI